MTDAATGAVVHTIDAANQTVLHADAEWALAATAATNGQYSLQIDRADGTTTAVSGSFSQPLVWVGTEAGTAYVRGADGSFSIDVTNGASVPLPIVAPERLEFVTPSTLVTFNATVDGTGAQTDHLRSLDRTTYDQSWSVDVPTDGHNHGYVVLGNGLGVMYAPDGAPVPVANHLDLRPVDLTTGVLGAPAASDVYDRLQLADGTVALTLDDTPGGPAGGGRRHQREPLGRPPGRARARVDVGAVRFDGVHHLVRSGRHLVRACRRLHRLERF